MRDWKAIPILNDEYKVIVCWGTPAKIRKVLLSWHHPIGELDSSLLNHRGVCFYHKDCHPVIALPSYPRKPAEIATLAHEAVHAIDDIMQKINETPTRGELFAHSVGAIVRLTLSLQNIN